MYHGNISPAGYVLKIDSMMSEVRLYLRPLQPSVCGLMSACNHSKIPSEHNFFHLHMLIVQHLFYTKLKLTRKAADIPTSCLLLLDAEWSTELNFSRFAQNSSALITWLTTRSLYSWNSTGSSCSILGTEKRDEMMRQHF